jgi:hypothetical protein
MYNGILNRNIYESSFCSSYIKNIRFTNKFYGKYLYYFGRVFLVIRENFIYNWYESEKIKAHNPRILELRDGPKSEQVSKNQTIILNGRVHKYF